MVKLVQKLEKSLDFPCFVDFSKSVTFLIKLSCFIVKFKLSLYLASLFGHQVALTFLAPLEARCSQAHAADNRPASSSDFVSALFAAAKRRPCRYSSADKVEPGQSDSGHFVCTLCNDRASSRRSQVGLLLWSLVQKTSIGELRRRQYWRCCYLLLRGGWTLSVA